MTTLIISALVVGVVLGGGISFKVGRGYERVRPTKKKKSDQKKR
jgi:membrane protein DedA with SNARE-associated domain